MIILLIASEVLNFIVDLFILKHNQCTKLNDRKLVICYIIDHWLDKINIFEKRLAKPKSEYLFVVKGVIVYININTNECISEMDQTLYQPFFIAKILGIFLRWKNVAKKSGPHLKIFVYR